MTITWLGAWAAIYAVTAVVTVAWRVSGPSTIAPACRSAARRMLEPVAQVLVLRWQAQLFA